MGNTKEINIKYRTYYFFDDMININYFDPSLIKIDKKSYKSVGIYYIGYITMKDSDHVKINSVNSLYLIIGEVDRCTEENNGNKYLAFASTDKNKKVLEKYTKLWDEIKYDIETINSSKSGECNPIEYDKDYMKIRFNSDDDSPLNKILKLHNLTTVVRSVFEEDGKYYPQVFLDECLHELQDLMQFCFENSI